MTSMTALDGVFVDTSALYAIVDRNEHRHAEVSADLEALMRSSVPLLTTDAVLTEFHGLALGRLGPATALDALDRVLASPRISVIATGPGDIRSAVELLRDRPERRLSLVDALSFGVMRELKLESALTLDGDFAAEGFTMRP